MLDTLIGYFSPRLAYQRAAWREAAMQVRGYALAARGRTATGWRGEQGSADAALLEGLPVMRSRSLQMVQDNPQVAAAVRNLTCALVGDGIVMRAVHPNESTRRLAQDIWDEACLTPVDGRRDFYGHQKLAVRTAIIGGEALAVWHSEDGRPDRRVTLLEGHHLDHTLNRLLDNGGRIVGGVEYDRWGIRVAYHLHPDHPSDVLARRSVHPNRIEARYVDHLFEELRPGQSRGAPWFFAALTRMRDIEGTDEAIRMKKRVEACLALFRRAPEGEPLAALGEREKQKAGPDHETLRPGMILMGKPGEEAPTVISPSSSGDGDGFQRQQTMAACAAMGVPHHIVSGDVSQANYSSIRTDTIAYHARLDDWTFHTLDPFMLQPAFRRVMLREALVRDMPELARVRGVATPPPRPWVDPLKDMMAKILEARAIPGALTRLLAELGVSPAEALAAQREINDLIDEHGVALDTDPRRVNGAGALQPAAGWLAPKDERALAEMAMRFLEQQPH